MPRRNDSLIMELFNGIEIHYNVGKQAGTQLTNMIELNEEVKARFLRVIETTDSTNFERLLRLAQEFSSDDAYNQNFNEIRYLIGHSRIMFRSILTTKRKQLRVASALVCQLYFGRAFL